MCICTCTHVHIHYDVILEWWVCIHVHVHACSLNSKQQHCPLGVWVCEGSRNHLWQGNWESHRKWDREWGKVWEGGHTKLDPVLGGAFSQQGSACSSWLIDHSGGHVARDVCAPTTYCTSGGDTVLPEGAGCYALEGGEGKLLPQTPKPPRKKKKELGHWLQHVWDLKIFWSSLHKKWLKDQKISGGGGGNKYEQ